MVLFFKDEGVGTVAGLVVVAAFEVVVPAVDPPATAVLLPDMVGCVVNVGAAVVDVVVKPGALVAVDDDAPDEAGVDVLPKLGKLKLGADVEVVVAVVVVALLVVGIVKPKPPVAGLAVEVPVAAAAAPKPPKPPVVDAVDVAGVAFNPVAGAALVPPNVRPLLGRAAVAPVAGVAINIELNNELYFSLSP